jgi:hypothetical protein
MCLTTTDRVTKRATVGFKVVKLEEWKGYRNWFLDEDIPETFYKVGETFKAKSSLYGISCFTTLQGARKFIMDLNINSAILKVAVRKLQRTGIYTFRSYIYHSLQCQEIKVLEEVKC